jgi:hypothetical protein
VKPQTPTAYRIDPSVINAHLHDKTHRHHLFTAAVVCLVEIGLIVGVEAVAVHLLVTLALFGREAAETLLGE